MSTPIISPISALSPLQNNLIVKVRVAAKHAMRTWPTESSESPYFSMDLMDGSGEIRAIAFRDQAVMFYDLIKENRVYYIKNFLIRPANENYTTLKNVYEMIFDEHTNIQDDYDVPAIMYDFVPISDVKYLELQTGVDVIGICTNVGELQAINEHHLRKLTLFDASEDEVDLNLWNADAESYVAHVDDVILVKCGRVVEYKDVKSIGVVYNSTVQINPNIPTAHSLREWYENM